MAEAEVIPSPIGDKVGNSTSGDTIEPLVGVAQDTVAVDRTECQVGDTLQVTWEVQSFSLHERDFIGMFEVGGYIQRENSVDDSSSAGCQTVTMEGLLDSRLRGDASIKGGLISWTMREDIFPENLRTFVRFCYYDHRNLLRASSSVVTVRRSAASSAPSTPSVSISPMTPLSPVDLYHSTNPDSTALVKVRLTDVSCKNLRKRAYYLPDTFLRFALTSGRGHPRQPHHGQKQLSSVHHSSTSPSWPEEMFVFEGRVSDVLTVMVRHHWSSMQPTTSTFLGRACIPFSIVLATQGQSTFDLQRRAPNDRISGSITITVEHLDHISAGPGGMVPIHPRLSTQMSVYSIDGSIDGDDRPPLVIQQTFSEGAEPTDSDIIPIVTVSEDSARADASKNGDQDPEHENDAPSSSQETKSDDCDHTPFPGGLERQQSEPLPPSTVREVLFGSRQRLGEGLIRHHSVHPRTAGALSPTSNGGGASSPLTSSPMTASYSPSSPTPQPFRELSSPLGETLPPNWEVRVSIEGRPLYYDHVNQRVSLDRPEASADGRGAATPTDNAPLGSLQNFLVRSRTNLLNRQPSNPLPDIPDSELPDGLANDVWRRSNTISEGVLSRRGRGVSRGLPLRPQTATAEPEAILEHRLEDSVGSNGDGRDNDEGGANKTSETTEARALEDEVKSKDNRDERTEESKEGKSVTDGGVVGGGARGELRTLKHLESVSESIRNSPGFKFLIRPDLYKFVKDQNNSEFFSNLPMLRLIQMIRSDHSLYPRYQNSSKLIKVINSFAQTDYKLPDGWEKRVDPKSKKVVFIDHTSQTTSYIDPRVPYPGSEPLTSSLEVSSAAVTSRARPYLLDENQPRPRPRLLSEYSHPSEQPRPSRPLTQIEESPYVNLPGVTPPLFSQFNALSRTSSQAEESLYINFPGATPPVPPPRPIELEDPLEESYSERVVNFLRQPDIWNQLQTQSNGPINFRLRGAIRRVIREGVPALNALSEEDDNLSLDLTLLLSNFDEEINHFIFPVQRSSTESVRGGQRPVRPVSLRSRSIRETRLPSPPRRVPPVPFPVVPPRPPSPEVDERTNTFEGLSGENIRQYFNDSSCYRHVLLQYNFLSPQHREYIVTSSESSPGAIMRRLHTDRSYRQFIRDLVHRIRTQFNLNLMDATARSLGSSVLSSEESRTRFLSPLPLPVGPPTIPVLHHSVNSVSLPSDSDTDSDSVLNSPATPSTPPLTPFVPFLEHPVVLSSRAPPISPLPLPTLGPLSAPVAPPVTPPIPPPPPNHPDYVEFPLQPLSPSSDHAPSPVHVPPSAPHSATPSSEYIPTTGDSPPPDLSSGDLLTVLPPLTDTPLHGEPISQLMESETPSIQPEESDVITSSHPEESNATPSHSVESVNATPSHPEESDAMPSHPEESDATPSRPEESDVTSSRPEEADATPSHPEEADATPSHPEESDVTSSRPEEADATPSHPEESDATPSHPEESDVTPSRPEESDATPSRPEESDATPSRPEESDVTPSHPEESDTIPPEESDATPLEEPNATPPEESEAMPSHPEDLETPPPSPPPRTLSALRGSVELLSSESEVRPPTHQGLLDNSQHTVEGVSGDLVLSYLSLMELSGPEAFEDHLLILPTFSEMTVMDLEDMMEEDEEFASFISSMMDNVRRFFNLEPTSPTLSRVQRPLPPTPPPPPPRERRRSPPIPPPRVSLRSEPGPLPPRNVRRPYQGGVSLVQSQTSSESPYLNLAITSLTAPSPPPPPPPRIPPGGFPPPSFPPPPPPLTPLTPLTPHLTPPMRDLSGTTGTADVSKKAASRFVKKLKKFQQLLDRNGYANSDTSTHGIEVKRDRLLESAYRSIMSTSTRVLRTKRCNITFNREEGLDYGGPQREFFFLVSRQLFNPYHGLFEYSSLGSYTIQISPHALDINDAELWYRFAGRLIGYAIIQGQLLDVFFARHVYKALLGRAYVLADVEAVDIAFHNSLQYVLENDPQTLDLTFSVLEETFGDLNEYELKPGGSGVAVTEENRKEYVRLMVEWRLSRGIKRQTDSLRLGLREMLPKEYLDQFDSQELEWVIAGTPEINVEDWKKNTLYWGVYSKTHPVIVWFWEVVESYTNELKLRLLQFVTGTSSIPFEGFKALRGSTTLQKFTIDILTGYHSDDMLPRSHTCFNRLDLPSYSSKIVLFQKLTLAIEECTSFENA